MNNDLKINTAAAIAGIIASSVLLLLIIPGTRLTAEMTASPFGMTDDILMRFGILGLAILASIIPTLVLFIIGCVQTSRAGLSVTGHILGFVGMGTYIFMPYGLDIISIGLIIAGSIIIMRITKAPTNEVPTNDWDSNMNEVPTNEVPTNDWDSNNDFN